MLKNIVKRDGRIALYDESKIAGAILKAMAASSEGNPADAPRIAEEVGRVIEERLSDRIPQVEEIQDAVEVALMRNGYESVAKQYILYRAGRTRTREMKTGLMKIYDELTNASANASDMKRDNANIDGDTAMGVMLKYGCEGAKDYYEKYLLTPEQAQAHRSGDIHIHDFDFYALTTTCCQIDLLKLFKGGFSTGHGFLREPNDIQSYSALACIAIQSNQNDQHGGQSVPNFDYAMAGGVKKTYRKRYLQNVARALELLTDIEEPQAFVKSYAAAIQQETGLIPCLANNNGYQEAEAQKLSERLTADQIATIQAFAKKNAYRETNRATYQAMEALIHNLNTMNSRAGAQTPFSSINYGTDTTPEGRMVIENVLLAEEAGLGNGETPIFPIHIFKVKEGVNYNKEDPNYDMFKLACRVSAKRLFPNFAFLDAPYNLQYYKPGDYRTEIAYMGCRTRVIGNEYDPTREIVTGRGNLSFTSINLPRLAIKANGDIDKFFTLLNNMMDLTIEQLTDRFAIQCQKKVRNYPFLMGQGVWLDSEGLGPDDSVAEVLKHGTLSVGFIGLAETLKALIGKHHGESAEAQELGLKIIQTMRDRTDLESKKTGLNFSVLATPAEGLSGRFVRMDRERYGVIPGVTDRDYYTNSFHVPVYYPIRAVDKIRLEAPYHALTNGGHISYVEMDGDPVQNVAAFEKVIRCMKEAGIGYGSVNHPVDRDPCCGFTGIIGDSCPQCGRTEHSGDVGFERIRRITGYLVGTLDRFNDAKRAEEHDRVKHAL